MNKSKRYLLVALFFGLSLGLLIGRMLWVNKTVQGQGATVFVVHSNTADVYLQAKGREKIQWVAPGPPGGPHSIPVYAHFIYGSPCKPDHGQTNNLSECTIKDKVIGGYPYECWDQPNEANHNVICKDPGIDPNSNFPILRTQPNKSDNNLSAPSDVKSDLNIHLGCVGDQVVAYDMATQKSVSQTADKAYPIKNGIIWELEFDPKIEIDPKVCTPQEYGSGRRVCVVAGNAPKDTYPLKMSSNGGACKGTATTYIKVQ